MLAETDTSRFLIKRNHLKTLNSCMIDNGYSAYIVPRILADAASTQDYGTINAHKRVQVILNDLNL